MSDDPIGEAARRYFTKQMDRMLLDAIDPWPATSQIYPESKADEDLTVALARAADLLISQARAEMPPITGSP